MAYFNEWILLDYSRCHTKNCGDISLNFRSLWGFLGLSVSTFFEFTILFCYISIFTYMRCYLGLAFSIPSLLGTICWIVSLSTFSLYGLLDIHTGLSLFCMLILFLYSLLSTMCVFVGIYLLWIYNCTARVPAAKHLKISLSLRCYDLPSPIAFVSIYDLFWSYFVRVLVRMFMRMQSWLAKLVKVIDLDDHHTSNTFSSVPDLRIDVIGNYTGCSVVVMVVMYVCACACVCVVGGGVGGKQRKGA